MSAARPSQSQPAQSALTARQRSACAMAAATLLNLPFGTIYAFSVFLKPMETMLGIGRAQMALVFSVASICLTLGMLAGPVLYRRFAPVGLLLCAGLCSAVGLLVAASATGIGQLMLGYGLLFGLGGGVAFVMMQQGLNQTVESMSGLANGYVVSLYPLGAMIGAPIFGWSIAAFGLRATLVGLAITVALATLAAALLLRLADIRMQDGQADAQGSEDRRWSLFARLFGVFFLAAAAGLMVMSQSAGILQAYGAATAFALGGTTFITGAIAAARIGGGWLVDRFEVPWVACGAHLIALAGSLLLLVFPGPAVAVLAMTLIGMGYGFVSGLTAGAIARYWHKNVFGRVASQLYIAWCVAAVSLPVVAGWLFDRTQAYHSAMMIAAVGNLLGAMLATSLPRNREGTR
ncbi:MAG: MFS transporter [Burkholderiales bacterium]|nr:MFS transporter [Burkholderiales bacterium]